jgi:flagellar protein FliS
MRRSLPRTHKVMVQKQKYQAYAAATQTVAKTKQIVMLYDGVIRLVQQGREAIREKRIEDRYSLLTKASDIIIGLQACLDFENGGDIARVLYQFYTTINLQIFSLHRTNSLETCDEVIADLKKMRDVWHEIDQKNAGTFSTASALPPEASDDASNGDPITLSA